jgi:hypothetical protein
MFLEKREKIKFIKSTCSLSFYISPLTLLCNGSGSTSQRQRTHRQKWKQFYVMFCYASSSNNFYEYIMHCHAEKVNLVILTNVHVFGTPEHDKVVYVIRVFMLKALISWFWWINLLSAPLKMWTQYILAVSMLEVSMPRLTCIEHPWIETIVFWEPSIRLAVFLCACRHLKSWTVWEFIHIRHIRVYPSQVSVQ